MVTFGFFAEIQIVPALFRLGQLDLALQILVVAAVERYDAALERRDRFDDRLEADRVGFFGKGLLEPFAIIGVGAETRDDLGVIGVVDAHLDRTLAEQWIFHLPFQRHQRQDWPRCRSHARRR